MSRMPLLSARKLFNTSARHLSIGNHSVERFRDENGIDYEVRFTYHWTDIFTVYPKERRIVINDGGFDTVSTRCAIRSYCYLYNAFDGSWTVEYSPAHSGRKYE